jgi:hypothetical protein
VIEAESQAVLNTLTEHDFQDAFKKKGKNVGNGEYGRKRTTSRVMMTSKPKVSFCPAGSTSPGNYGRLFVHVSKYHYSRLQMIGLSLHLPIILLVILFQDSFQDLWT